MSEQEFLAFQEKQASRRKLLEPYEDFVRLRLEDCPSASAAQIHDWLKENFEDFVKVNEKTVFNFVLWVRNQHNIPKPFNHRDFEQVPPLPYGKQAQVDFGEYNMTTEEGLRKKVYFFSMVLSRSRQKYVVFRDKPFDTIAVIDAHEKAFQFYMGVPEQLVYDQDTLMLVNENKGDLVLTDAFRQYTVHRKFKLYFCRKSDPQTKGKIENVIKYIKYNFLRGRKYIDLPILNGEALAWQKRTANAKVHAATKKVPQQEWIKEKQHLKPIGDLFTPQQAFTPYKVRKDNTIVYKSNFYRVPRGTYQGEDTVVNVKIGDEQMVIYDINNTEIIRYKLHKGKGKLIQNNNCKRDYSSKIQPMIQQLCEQFNDPGAAEDYLQQIRRANPRYIRDQLMLIRTLIKVHGMEVMNQALDFCIQNKIYKATDMQSLAEKLEAENKNRERGQIKPIQIKTLNKSAFKIIPQKSDISDYNKLMD